MKNFWTILAAVVLVVVLGLYMCSYQVRFTEVAIVKTWGKPAPEARREAGLYWKLPAPIQRVVTYDGRVRTLEDRTEETRTIDGKNLVLTTYTLWRIGDPSRFHQSIPQGEDEAARKLRTTIITHKHAVVGKRSFSEFVSTDADRRKLHDIENEMKTLVARDAMNEFGIEIVGFGIKKLGLPTAVTSQIFQAMKAHENGKARQYESEGKARYDIIVASATNVEARIMAAVGEKVAQIQNEAQAAVGEMYREFDRNPELRIYLDKLSAMRDALRKRSTLIIDTSFAPFDLFNATERARLHGDGTRQGASARPTGEAQEADKQRAEPAEARAASREASTSDGA